MNISDTIMRIRRAMKLNYGVFLLFGVVPSDTWPLMLECASALRLVNTTIRSKQC